MKFKKNLQVNFKAEEKQTEKMIWRKSNTVLLKLIFYHMRKFTWDFYGVFQI